MINEVVVRHTTYRPDIDGLRAIAVLAVVAFHLHFSLLSGGYVGVDIFFVISGYLITGILLKELEGDRFSIARFYERRARRILPALLVVLIFSAMLAYKYLLPNEFEGFAWSLLSTVGSYSNIYFWTKASYFNADGPLLHTWSLAVEEQFYLLFPLFMMAVFRYRRTWLLPATMVLAAISFATSIVLSYKFPTANFYMPYTRAWELLIGSFLAIRMPALKPLRRMSSEIYSVAGALLIAYCLFIYTDATRFPGLSALTPCLGTALIIFAGGKTNSLIGYFLSSRILTFIGAISYSLYLWHWPVLMFNFRGFLYFGNLTHRENVAVYLFVCFFLAWMSWKFVENPFRLKHVLSSQRQVFIGAGLGTATIAFIAAAILLSHGVRSRYPPAALEIVAQFSDANSQTTEFRKHQCFLVSPEPFSHFSPTTCLQIDPAKKNFILLGDSHAAALWYALNNEVPDLHVLQATASACKPFPGQSGSDACPQLMNFIYDKYLKETRVDAIVLNARWKNRDMAQINQVVQLCRSRNLRVIVIGPSEEYDSPLPVLLAFALRSKDPNLPNRHRVTQIEELDRTMKAEAAAKWHTPYISLIEALCPSKTGCYDYTPGTRGVPVLFDHDHYTKSGAEFAFERLHEMGKLEALEQPKDAR